MGNIALNNVVTDGSISPASPSAGGQFNLTGFQSEVALPSQIVTAAAALGNSAIVGTANVKVDATGATPASVSSGTLTIDTPIPSPVPSTGLQLSLPSSPATIGPFTAGSSGTITLTVDPDVNLSLNVSGSTLTLTCHPYPNNTEATGIVTSGPSGAEAAPVIATTSVGGGGGGTTTTTVAPTTTTVAPTTTTTSGTTTTVTGAYELYCPGTPVGNVVLNGAETVGTLSPPDPTSGSTFQLTGYQTTVNLPSGLAGAAAALGSTINGSADATIDASGATPAKTPENNLSFNVPIPSTIPSAGIPLTVPATPATASFTATSDKITIQEDSAASLTVNVAGAPLTFTCTSYPNNSVESASGITTSAPTAAPIAPVIAVGGSSSTSTTLPPPTTTTSSTTLPPSTTTTTPPTTTTTLASTTSTTAVSTLTAATTTTLPPSEEAATPIQFSGTGQTATQAFTLAGGLNVFTGQCSCQGNFIVEVDTVSGSQADIPLNVIGNAACSGADQLMKGQYLLNVTADGPWSVTITQPRNVPGATLPQTYTGTGEQAVGPLAAVNGVRVQAQNTSTDDSNFVVQILGSDGSLQGIPINAIGSFDGSGVSTDLENGPYWLNVESDGTWTITVSTPAATGAATTTSSPETSGSSSTASPGHTARVVTASSASLAFTGPGAGVTLLITVGGALVVLGISALVLADAPHRLVARLAGHGPRRTAGVSDGGLWSLHRRAADMTKGIWQPHRS